MREIKFRCWDIENKEMLEVQELDYADSYDGQPMIRTTMYNDYFDTEDMILMQYTGLKDKNGKEIYEGDIVTCGSKDIKYLIEWQDTGLKGRQWNNNSYIGLKYWQKDLEVIGNIYDNSEMLGGNNGD